MEAETLDRTKNPVNRIPSRPETQEQSDQPDERGISLKVLLADVDPELMENCRRLLEHEGHDCEMLSEAGAIRNAVARDSFDLVFLYERIPGLDTEAILRMAQDQASGTLVVLTADKASPERSRRAMGMGAWDYLPKPFASGQLMSLLGRAAYTVGRTHRIRGSAGQDGVLLKNGLTILGISPQIRTAVDKALRVAATDAPVFITGESGTGKELFSRLIHEHSWRAARGSFVPLNCAALPGELLESEMFGHRKGAFTGAVRDKPGILETAHRGTVFLDEIGEMPVTLQAKLLRVVQDGALRRVGSEEMDRKVDVRIISATNRPMALVRSRSPPWQNATLTRCSRASSRNRTPSFWLRASRSNDQATRSATPRWVLPPRKRRRARDARQTMA
jgi:DNA-binding NtrC family response regulator